MLAIQTGGPTVYSCGCSVERAQRRAPEPFGLPESVRSIFSESKEVYWDGDHVWEWGGKRLESVVVVGYLWY